MESAEENNHKSPVQEPLANQLSEVGAYESPVEYAGFWRRVAASLFDNAVTFIFGLGIVIVLVVFDIPVPQVVGDFVPLLIFWLYFSLMESSVKQATVGKMILGIKVTSMDGGRISFLRATGRTFAKILSVIPLGIGFLMVAFTKRKQGLHDKIAKTLVVKHGKSHLWKAILISFISFLLMLGAIGAYGYFVLWPRIVQNFFIVTTVISEPTQISDIEPLEEEVVSQSQKPVSVTEAEYDALLINPPDMEGKKVGPAVLVLSNFWDHPSVWIETMLPLLPNFNLGLSSQRFTKIEIDKVLNKQGDDVYDRENSFERDFFQSFSVSQHDQPVPHLQGIRGVNLISGTEENDLDRFEGKLILQLPLDIKTATFTSGNLGETVKIGNVTVVATAMKDSQVLWHYTGDGKNFIAIKAYNGAGEELGSALGTSWPSRGGGMQDWDLKGLFKGTIASFEISVASRIAEREYPFVLTK